MSPTASDRLFRLGALTAFALAPWAITYGIIDGVPVESHEATITVTGSGDGTHVTWVVDAAPDDMADLMQSVYQQSLEALKAHVEG